MVYMGKTKKVGVSGNLGARYGSSIRKRVRELRTRQKLQIYRCPRCFSGSASRSYVKRRSVGIWECRKCNHVWAGGAWSPQTDRGRDAKRFVRRMTAEEEGLVVEEEET